MIKEIETQTRSDQGKSDSIFLGLIKESGARFTKNLKINIILTFSYLH